MPTLHWTSYYHFTNPLCLPLSNTHIDIERNQDMLYRLTTPLTHRQFTYIGYKKSLKSFTAHRANEYTLEYYDHNIIRTNQDQFLDDDRFANPSNCKADTKNKGYQEIMFFDWKIQLEKIQLTRDLSDNTMIYQGIRLPCKNDQGYCDPTTRTQATIVWFPEDTCTTFQVAKIHARMIKFHEK